MDSQPQAQHFLAQDYHQLQISYDSARQAVWCHMWPSRPCCTPDFLSELRHLLHAIEQHIKSESEDKKHVIRYLIIASRIPGLFNLGGDLGLFLKLIRSKNREGLYRYAKSSIDIAYAIYHLPVTTIALVQGDAFGGGFEGALVSRALIAERQARMGIPDVLFNLLPICAYSLLARRLDPTQAERLILSGRTYTAAELYDMGIVDVLVENGEGEEAVNVYIKKQNRANNSYEAIHRIRQIYNPLNYDELMRISEVWVDTALRLGERDLRVMERIAHAQEKLAVFNPAAVVKQLA